MGICMEELKDLVVSPKDMGGHHKPNVAGYYGRTGAAAGLKAVPVDDVITWPQRLGGFDRQFEGLKRLDGMAVVSRHVKRRV
jgi:hypothetical protein